MGSTLKFTRLTGEKSASSRMALMGSASGSRFSAPWYPRPRSMHTSISSAPSLSSVASATSGFRIWTSASGSKSPAFTWPPPWAFIRRILGRFTCSVNTTLRRFMMMSSVSSVIPGMWENSWRTFSILTHVGAAPWMADRSTRRYAMPTVSANPGSNGSMVSLP
jgi:hypothetical protein